MKLFFTAIGMAGNLSQITCKRWGPAKQKTAVSSITKFRSTSRFYPKSEPRLECRICEHLDGEIWKLRPIRDRILFAWLGSGAFVLLHPFMKQSQKTPPEEITQAKIELEDFKARYDGNKEE